MYMPGQRTQYFLQSLGIPSQLTPEGNAGTMRLPTGGTRVAPPKGVASKAVLLWSEALIGTAEDAVKGAPGTNRMVVGYLGGFSPTDTQVDSIAAVYRRLGLALYPKIEMHRWLEKLTARVKHGKRSLMNLEPDPGASKWRKMSVAERLAWIEAEDQEMAKYESLGPLTGGQALVISKSNSNVAQILATDIATGYTAVFTPKSAPSGPVRHEIEIRLRDASAGQMSGGVRVADY
jgi:hypothetical protein